jgi:hemin uptake protein HemP
MNHDEHHHISSLQRVPAAGRAMTLPQIAAAASPRPDVPAHDARTLTEGGSLAHIVMDGIAYTLRITRNGKLILTK